MNDMEQYGCLIVDDEPIARKVIAGYIEQIPSLQLAAEAINALTAMDYLRTHDDVAIIFLDINMPHLSGLQLLKILQPQQPVIFTTAYSEYAVESYNLNAVDYLLKPFSFERFTKAVYKAIDVIKNVHQNTAVGVTEEKLIYVKSNGKNYPVFLDDILYCEARKNYTMVLLKDGQKLMPLIPLSRVETYLAYAGGTFIQVHRSFLVAKKHITAIGSNNVTVHKWELPIGVQFKERLSKAMGINNKE
jgi:DNA-binding LytR/AlgR family response regulator